MADLKISQLPVASTPLAGTELVPIVQGGTTDQTTVEAILTGTVPGGTANGVLFLNGSKVVTSGSALQFNGSQLLVGGSTTVGSSAFPRFTALVNTGNFLIGAQGSANGAIRAGIIHNITANLGGLVFATGGDNNTDATEKMRLDASGNLGIGTNNPGTKLDVNGSAVGSNFYIRPGSAGTYGLADLSAAIQTYSGSVSPANAVLFLTNAAERMRLDSAGNLGLGVTPSATQAAHRSIELFGSLWMGGNSVTPASYFYTNAYFDGADRYKTSGFAASLYRQVSGAHAWLTAPSGTAGNAISFTQAMTLDASGNLVIGASSTIASGLRLDVVSSTVGDNRNRIRNTTSGEAFLLFQNSDTGTTASSGLIIGILSTEDSYLYNYHNSPIIFGTNSAERLRLDANGNVIVNTAAIATNATNGFLYVPTCAGTPTGTPTTYTGRSPIVVDSTNNKLYFYSGGAWRDAGP